MKLPSKLFLSFWPAGHTTLRRPENLLLSSLSLFFFASVASAQIAPIQQPPQWKVPSGTAACSVEKSCAELAPAMMQSALGPSPVEENLRYLMHRVDTPRNPQGREKTTEWATAAFRKSRVDAVRTEKFFPGADGQIRDRDPQEASQNLVAEIRGREKPNEYVLLGTNLGWRTSRKSSLEDVSSAAVLIDAARVIQSSGNIPRRSIRLVLFADEKPREGSLAYIRAHRTELDRLIAAVIFEGGAARINGYSLGGREDALTVARKALEPLRPLGVKNFTLNASSGSDRFPFILEGVPTLAPDRESATRESKVVQTELNSAEVAELKRQVAIAAITGYALADDLERIAPRQSRAQIERLLAETGLEQQMKVEGLWPAWETAQWP